MLSPAISDEFPFFVYRLQDDWQYKLSDIRYDAGDFLRATPSLIPISAHNPISNGAVDLQHCTYDTVLVLGAYARGDKSF